MYYFIKKHSNLEDAEKKEKFLKKFGTFFNEFKSGNFCLFYLIFVLRRYLIMIVFLFVKVNVVQLMILAALSCAVRIM